MFDPVGKRVLITGSSAGLGAEMARGLAARGAIVGICGRREDRLAEVLADIHSFSPQSRSWAVDLADLDALDSFAESVTQEFGGIDVLVNNAGIPKRRWAWEHRPDEISDVLRINLESPIRLTLGLLDSLANNSGQMVFVGSVAARLSPPAEAVYASSKAAITAFAECLRVDLSIAGTPIGVHVLQPGVLDTELFAHPDNDSSLSDIEALPASAILQPLIDLLGSNMVEAFVPDWFTDLPPVKTGDPEGFLQGAAEYTLQRLSDLGMTPPVGPGATK